MVKSFIFIASSNGVITKLQVMYGNCRASDELCQHQKDSINKLDTIMKLLAISSLEDKLDDAISQALETIEIEEETKRLNEIIEFFKYRRVPLLYGSSANAIHSLDAKLTTEFLSTNKGWII